ncbi:MAG: response regulator [Bacteroidota bacterium]|nr:response regulator [Bacteroidota bacterium]
MPEHNPYNQSGKVNILIVEDEQITAKELRMSLEKMGYTVCATATSYQEALTFANANRPDIALMDIHIDGNKDGIQTAKALKTHYDIPVIFLTSQNDLEIVQKAKESDPFGYLIKPFRKSDLQTTIEIALFNHKKSSTMKEDLDKFTTAVQVLEVPIMMINAEGQIDYFNNKVEEISGWRKSEKQNHSLNQILTLEDMPAWLFIETKLTGYSDKSLVFDGNSFISHRNGQQIPVSGSISSIQNPDGNIAGYIIRVLSPEQLQLQKTDKTAQSTTIIPDNDDEFNTHINDNYFFLKDKSSFYRIPIDSILYVEALGNYVKVHTAAKTYMTLSPLKVIEKLLPDNLFYRIHRSFIAALNKITAVHSSDVQIGEKMLPIGKTYRDELMKKIKRPVL